MNKINKFFFLFLIGYSHIGYLHADFPKWFTKFVTKDLTLLSTSSRLIEIGGFAFQLPFGKKFFGYDEQTLLNMLHTKMQIDLVQLQKVAQLGQLFKDKNPYWDKLSLFQQMILPAVLMHVSAAKYNQRP